MASIEIAIKRDNETCQIRAMYNLSKDEAEEIVRAFNKYSKSVRYPITLTEFAASVMNDFESSLND